MELLLPITAEVESESEDDLQVVSRDAMKRAAQSLVDSKTPQKKKASKRR